MTKTWQTVLDSAGFPTQAIVLDFETVFDSQYNLSKMSVVEYVCDKRFEIMGLGYQTLGNGSEVRGFLTPDEVGPYLVALTSVVDQYTLVFQHAPFDALILREKFGITPRYPIDILDLARHLDSRDRHDLAHLAVKYGAPRLKGDTKQFAGMHWDTMTPEQHAAMIEYCRDGDVQIEAYLFKTLLPRITRPEVELRLAAQTLRMFLTPQIKIDIELGHKLIGAMKAELQKTIDAVNVLGIKSIIPAKITKRTSKPPTVRAVVPDDISGDKSFLALLTRALPTGESVPMKQGKKKLIPALAKTDEQLNYLLSHPCPEVRALIKARKATDSWPTHISRVGRLIAQAAARDGPTGAPLTYYAAHTGRYGGTGGTNWHNFGARDVHPLVKQVGQMLCAPDGYVFGFGDLSQIEARVVAWFAGQNDLLQAFAEGRDVYSEFAQEQIYHKETRKLRKDDPPELAATLTTRRNVGKETILGAGFGMGGNTFYERCKQKPSLKTAFELGELTGALCLRAITTYRTRYPMIPRLWQEVEKAWRFVAKYADQRATVSHCGRTLRFWNEGGTVVVQLPSSRCLFYPHAKVNAEGRCSYRWGHLWGGTIVENIVQATARDVFTDGLLRLEDAGFNSVFHVHDQDITLLVDDGTAKARLAEMHRLQMVVPVWAEGLPVAVEGELCARYHK